MSDSDSELLLPNNVFTFQNESTMVSARGPNTIANNITGISFQRSQMSERQRYAASNYDSRSMYHRRETSPMSVMSACDMRQRNFNSSLYPRGMSSQRSVFNGRSGSPMSQRSMDSSASVSAADIVMAFKSVNFNKYDLRAIKDAYNKFMKRRVRKKIEKRRNLRLFLKGSRRNSGGDSGEQGSDSSLSSDDRSTRTFKYKENMSSCRTDISNFRRTIKESNMYKDCTESFRYNLNQSGINRPTNLNNTLSTHRSMVAGSNMSSFRSMPMPANFNNVQKKPTIVAIPQKDRFKSGSLLPSQRFNRSFASTAILENSANINNHSTRNNIENKMNTNKNSAKTIETDSDQDDIFSAAADKQKTNDNIPRKRCIDSDDDISLPDQKRSKIASPCKNSIEARKNIPKETNLNTNNNVANDFVFAKPAFPVRKLLKEKLISKSAAPISDTFVPTSVIAPTNKEQLYSGKPVEQEEEEQVNEQSNTIQNTTDLSMRPSFIKRKLFTQKLDVSEKRNLSTDSVNSPQNSIYGAIQKEKHKARKLQQATTQSCLSRDIQQDESNLLDLIHKIVPLEQMNVTNQTNKTEIQYNTNKSNEKGDTWDVTSIISAQNHEEDGSDTYTDEEIFNATVRELNKNVSKNLSPINGKKVAKENCSKEPSPVKKKGCSVLLEKLPANCLQQNIKTNLFKNDVANKSVKRGIKSFWDTDFESDAECHPPSRIHNINYKENQIKDTHPKEATKFQGFSSIFNSKKPISLSISNASTNLNNTVDSVQKFSSTSLRIRSHRAPKRKKLHQTIDDDDTISVISEAPCIRYKTSQESSCIAVELKKGKSNPQQCKETVTKQLSKQNNKRSPKVKKPAINKNNKTKDSIEEMSLAKEINHSNKRQIKTGQTETNSNDNEQVIVQSKQQIKSVTTNNKQTKITTRKKINKNNKTTDSIEEIPLAKQINQSNKRQIKTGQTETNSNDNEHDIVQSKQQTKRDSTNNILTKIMTRKQTNENKKITDSIDDIPLGKIINHISKRQIKTAQTETSPTNNEQDILKSKQQTKRETANNIQFNITTRRKININNNTTDSIEEIPLTKEINFSNKRQSKEQTKRETTNNIQIKITTRRKININNKTTDSIEESPLAKQINRSNKRQNKLVQNETNSNNNKQNIVQSKQQTKRETTNNILAKIMTRKQTNENNKTTDSINDIPLTKLINHISKRQIKTAQNETSSTNNEQNILQSKQQTKRNTTNNKQTKITTKRK